MLDPAPDGDVVNGEPTFRHHLLQIAICERVSKVPANAQEDDHVFKMSSAEECWPFSGHDTPYQITSTAFATEPIDCQSATVCCAGMKSSIPNLSAISDICRVIRSASGVQRAAAFKPPVSARKSLF